MQAPSIPFINHPHASGIEDKSFSGVYVDIYYRSGPQPESIVKSADPNVEFAYTYAAPDWLSFRDYVLCHTKIKWDYRGKNK